MSFGQNRGRGVHKIKDGFCAKLRTEFAQNRGWGLHKIEALHHGRAKRPLARRPHASRAPSCSVLFPNPLPGHAEPPNAPSPEPPPALGPSRALAKAPGRRGMRDGLSGAARGRISRGGASRRFPSPRDWKPVPLARPDVGFSGSRNVWFGKGGRSGA